MNLELNPIIDCSRMGVIEEHPGGFPIYHNKSLNIPGYKKLPGRLLISGYFVVSGTFCVLYEMWNTENISYNTKNGIFSMVMSMIYTLLTLGGIYKFRYVVQNLWRWPYWQARDSQQELPNKLDLPMNLPLHGFMIFSVVVLISAYCYQMKYCRCKTCIKVKDVKIRYLEEYLMLAETNKINRQFLVDHFGMCKNGERISLYLENGKVVHTFSTDICIQLHEGTYIIKTVKESYPDQQQTINGNETVILRYLGRTEIISASTKFNEKQTINRNGKVKLRYLGKTEIISASTKFNEKQLRHWFGIDSNGGIAIQLENGKILHTLYEKDTVIQLQEGNYIIRTLNLDPDVAEPLLQRSTVGENSRQADCTILNVD